MENHGAPNPEVVDETMKEGAAGSYPLMGFPIKHLI
jgi:hypothetical protein